MGLKKTLQNAVKTAFSVIDELLVDVTYTRITVGAYDTATGKPAKTSVPYALKGLVENYKAQDADGSLVKRTDLRLTIRQTELAFMPSIEDTVTVTGQKYKVVDIKPDTGNVLWLLQLRRL